VLSTGLSLVLAACGGGSGGSPGSLLSSVPTTSFAGIVAADEPLAVETAREILLDGGTAADAAVALYFTLAVTYPSVASLGGGGMCVVHDAPSGQTLALDFLPRRPSTAVAGTDRPAAVPGNVRGMFALQARFGRLRWQQLVIPAELMATDGVPLSRALAHDLAAAAPAIARDQASRQVFADGRGRIITEGQTLLQRDLSSILAGIRARGATDFYSGETAQEYVNGVAKAGGSVSLDDLRSYAPVWYDPVTVDLDGYTVYTVPGPALGGLITAEMWAILNDEGRYLDAGPDEREHLFLEVAERVYGDAAHLLRSSSSVAGSLDRGRLGGLMANYDPDRHTSDVPANTPLSDLQENPAGTSFVVADALGSAVACGFTMNNLFGIGRIAPGTGIVPAAAPSPGYAPIGMAPLLLVDAGANEVYLAASASGGVGVPTALVQTIFAAVYEQQPLQEAVGAVRLHHGGYPDVVLYEPGAGEDGLDRLRRRGHKTAEVNEIGRVNIFFCPDGLPGDPITCAVRSDRRGYGLGTSF